MSGSCTWTAALLEQYWIWLSGLFTGKLGTSLANGQPLWALVKPRLINSAVLVFVTGAIGSIIGVVLGARGGAAQGLLVRPRHLGDQRWR